MAMNSPLISVIIPTFSRPRQLNQCLERLSSQTYPHDRFEVVVVDDGGALPLDELVDRHRGTLNVKLLRQENRGPAAARNRGASVAIGTLLAFTDDDCLPEPDWLEALSQSNVRNPKWLLGGTMVNHCVGNVYAITSQLIMDSAYAYYNRNPNDARFFASSNIALPAEGFNAVGGFSEVFRPASEDRELCDRWRWMGHRLLSVPDAVVKHSKELGPGSFLRQHFNYGRGAFQYHRERIRRRSASLSREILRYPVFLWSLIASVARQPMRRVIPVAALLLVAQLANAVGFLSAAVCAFNHRT